MHCLYYTAAYPLGSQDKWGRASTVGMPYPTLFHLYNILCEGIEGVGGSSLGGHLGAVPSPEAQLLAATQARVGPSFGVWVGARSGLGWREGCPAGSACAQPPLALSFSRRARRAGQRPGGRQLLGSRAGAAAATRGARRLRAPWGRPGARLCLRRCRGPGPQEAGAIVRPELGTAPSGATLAGPDPSLAGVIAETTAFPAMVLPSGMLCAMRTLPIATSNKGSGACVRRKSRVDILICV